MHPAKEIHNEISDPLRSQYEPNEASNIAFLLLSECFNVSQSDLMLNALVEIDEVKLDEYVKRLLNNEPIQYVTGNASFFGRNFSIQEGALIPRPETEELVKLIIDENKIVNPSILDVGTGSGCIAISLALEMDTMVFGTDISKKALKIAEENSRIHDARTEFFIHDVLKERLDYEKLDVLVSNPPYIPEHERQIMHKNVLDYEPAEALFVRDEDPLIFYREIGDSGLRSLKAGGKLYFEIHERFGDQVAKLLQEIGFSEVKVYQDMLGKDRMIRAINRV